VSKSEPEPFTEFTIVHFPDGWRILQADGQRWGRFPYRVDAEEAALRLGEKIRAEGGRARILAQDLTGEIGQVHAA
jgi:hypothetical protein